MNSPIIQVKNLKTKYGNTLVLDDLSFNIHPNEITVILGTSGCGKTTLIKSIVRLIESEAESISFFGNETVDISDENFQNIITQIGMLFQNGALLNSIDIFSNISIPLEMHTNLSRDLIEKMVKVKLDLVNLSHAMHLLPSELSGGMKKRAGLARALALDPKILFCDEPSAGLDPVTSASLDDLLLNLKKQLNMTFVIVTHELASIHRIADRIIFLENGAILFSGKKEEALSSEIPALKRFFEVGKF